MLIHCIVAGAGRVAGFLAGGEKAGKVIGHALSHAAGDKGFRYVILVLIGHIHCKFVADKSKEGAVKFLVEGRVEVLSKEVVGLGQTLQRLLCGLAVTGTHNVGPACGNLPEAKPEATASKKEERKDSPPGLGIYQEAVIGR